MSSVATSYQNLRSSQKFQKRWGIAWRLVVALILIFFSIFPVLWIISASFSSSQSLSTQTLIPPKVSMLNYQRLFGIGSQLINLEIWSTKNGSLIPSKLPASPRS